MRTLNNWNCSMAAQTYTNASRERQQITRDLRLGQGGRSGVKTRCLSLLSQTSKDFLVNDSRCAHFPEVLPVFDELRLLAPYGYSRTEQVIFRYRWIASDRRRDPSCFRLFWLGDVRSYPHAELGVEDIEQFKLAQFQARNLSSSAVRPVRC